MDEQRAIATGIEARRLLVGFCDLMQQTLFTRRNKMGKVDSRFKLYRMVRGWSTFQRTIATFSWPCNEFFQELIDFLDKWKETLKCLIS